MDYILGEDYLHEHTSTFIHWLNNQLDKQNVSQVHRDSRICVCVGSESMNIGICMM